MKGQENSIDWLQDYEGIIAGLKPFEADLKDLDEDLWKDLVSFVDNYRQTKIIINNENRKLKLGIIGQVKAGKSSFLNELLFDGEDVLPKASTPMTAALTELSHGEGFAVELTYYDRDDWTQLQEEHDKVICLLQRKRNEYSKSREANGPNLSMEDISGESNEQLFARFGNELGMVEKSSYELIKAAEKIQNLKKLLGQSSRNQYGTLKELQQALPGFVGVGGQVTPLVKSCRLELNLPALMDIDLVDTPGMNDPIISRGLKTKEHLKKCDAVFLLSSATQFLDRIDLELIRCYLPGEAISSIEPMASKFDSALISEAHRHMGDLQKTRIELQKVLESEITRKVQEALKGADEGSILQRLRGIEPLWFSSYLAGFARMLKTGRQAEVADHHNYKLLCKKFPTTAFDADLLYALSGLAGAQSRCDKVKASKEEIFRKRLADLDPEKKRQSSCYLDKLRLLVRRQEKLLVEGDSDKLEKQMHKLTAGIASCRDKISWVFDNELTKIRHTVNELIEKIEDGAAQAGKVSVETRHETEYYRVVINEFKNLFNDDWGCETRTRTVTTKVADTYEAIDKLERYGRSARRAVREEIAAIFGSESFKTQIRVALTKAILDYVDKDTDHDSILGPLNKAINKLSVAKFEFDESAYVKIVSSKFSGSVSDSKIDKLRKAQREAASAMVKAIVAELTKHTDSLAQTLQKAGDSFGDTIIKRIEQEHAKLATQLKDRKGTIERYQKVEKIIGGAGIAN